MRNKALTKQEIIFIIIITVIGIALFMLYFFSPKNGKNVILRQNGKIIGEYAIDINKKIVVKTKDNKKNIVIIKDKKVSVVNANCSDKICVNRGKIDKTGESIICLPHKLIVEVVNTNKSQKEIDAVAK